MLFSVCLYSCDSIPADPERSFEKAGETGLAVGYTSNPPWVSDNNGMAEGIEADIIKGFAKANKLKIVWEYGSEQTIMKKLMKKQLHIVIAGLTKETPWKSEKIGITMPYYKTKEVKHIIAVRQGENKLVMNLEKYFFQNKDSINARVNENKP